MTANADGKEASRGGRKQWLWIMLMVNMIFVLLLVTLGIIALRVGNYLPYNTDVIFIVGKNPEVVVGDEETPQWEAGQNVQIFRTSYENGQGVVTVLSEDGTDLVAPGTEMSYEFTMCNNGNMAVIYETDLDFTLKIGTEVQETYDFPMEVRLVNEQGEYLIGSETEWVNVKDAILARHVNVLGASSYETFHMDLRWRYESGNDLLDTYWGDLSAKEDVTLTLGINTYAEEHFDSEAKGGTELNVEGTQEYGGTIRWMWLILLMTNAGILIFYVSWLMNKRRQDW
ncbi:MAG: hypothetical protein IJX72_02185 [Clostridia bacterium]|nr:hypothetical protein [Clostridia bacterium]